MTIGRCTGGTQLCCCNIQVEGEELGKAERHTSTQQSNAVRLSAETHRYHV